MRQALDQTTADWIGDVDEHDRHRAGHLQQWLEGRRAGGQEDVSPSPNQTK